MGFSKLTKLARASTIRWMFGLAAVVLVMTMAGQLFAQTAPASAAATAAVATTAPAATTTAPAPVTGAWAQQTYDTATPVMALMGSSPSIINRLGSQPINFCTMGFVEVPKESIYPNRNH